jgi:hypothetical protein
MVFIKRSYAVPDDSEGPIHPNILLIREYQRRIDAANAPLVPATSEAETGQLADVPVVRVTKSERARTWLAQVLQHGPVPQKQIEAQAIADFIGSKALKTAKRKLRVQSIRKGRSHWVWALPMANAPDDGRE